MSGGWKIDFHMGEREDEAVPCSPFTYLAEAIKRKSPQSFFVTASCLGHNTNYMAHPVVAVAHEQLRHTPDERKLFLDNVVMVLELMEAQRNVDRD